MFVNNSRYSGVICFQVVMLEIGVKNVYIKQMYVAVMLTNCAKHLGSNKEIDNACLLSESEFLM